jgi:hypothetical protein
MFKGEEGSGGGGCFEGFEGLCGLALREVQDAEKELQVCKLRAGVFFSVSEFLLGVLQGVRFLNTEGFKQGGGLCICSRRRCKHQDENAQPS